MKEHFLWQKRIVSRSLSVWVTCSLRHLLRAGVKLGTMALITVRGRTSGLPRTTPVTLLEQDGRRWLASPFGDVNWVRNLRAAGEATLTRGRHSEKISAVELTAAEAAPILKQSLARAPALFDRTLM